MNLDNYKVVTITGSSQFKDEIIKQKKLLMLQGYVVFVAGVEGHDDDMEELCKNRGEGTEEMLHDITFKQIMMSEFLFVINKGEGNINKETKRDISIADDLGKKIRYLCNRKAIPVGTRVREKGGTKSITKIKSVESSCAERQEQFGYYMENGTLLYSSEFIVLSH